MSQTLKRVSCGLDLSAVYELSSSLKAATNNRYEFICLPLVHPRFKREFVGICKDRNGPFTRPDLVLQSSDWSSLIVGKMSPYINVDAPEVTLRQHSESTFDQELGYASHLDVPAIFIKLHGLNSTNLARMIFSKVLTVTHYQVWVLVPLVSPKKEASKWRSDNENIDIAANDSTWDWWNQFRTLCSFNKRIGVVLEISNQLPSQLEWEKWLGEPIKAILLSTSVFLTNKKGFPVLSKPHQAFIKTMAGIDAQIIVKGHDHHGNLSLYQRYLDHLWQELNYQTDPVADFARGYEDCLQTPLQPLKDNLASHTYEVFEKDPVKYTEYSRAIYHALLDSVSEEEKETKVVGLKFDVNRNLMVVGAGRGPLLEASFTAADKADRLIKIYAVEKNPNAVITLQTRQKEAWGDKVIVCDGDIRNIKLPVMIDIMVSELLGSFGDNELSPECLDAAQKYLKKGGISIPRSYTSYLCPVQSSKLYNEVKLRKEYLPFEKPYVAYQRNKFLLSSAQPLFSFHHPNYDDPIDNSRYKTLTFEVTQNTVLHGFSGFFDTALYKDIELSIVPETYSYGMFSWFPIFFPLSRPVQLKTGDKIDAHFWRYVNNTDVWYEWTVSKPAPLFIHNANGRSYKIRLST